MTPFDAADSYEAAASYQEDPAAVECPRCGLGTIEVVAFLDATALEQGHVRTRAPHEEYAVLLYCHSCKGCCAVVPDFDEAPSG